MDKLSNLHDVAVLVFETLALWSGQDVSMEMAGRKWEPDHRPAIVVECQQRVSLYKHVIKI